MSPALFAEVSPLAGNLAQIQERWAGLAGGVGTFALCPTWVNAWLECLGPEPQLSLVTLRRGQEPVAAFFLGRRRAAWRGIIPIDSLYLNATGWPDYDSIFIEYNGMALPGPEPPRLEEVLDALPGDWDELYLPGLDMSCFPGDQLGSLSGRYKVREDQRTPSPFMDLELVRGQQGDCLNLLGSKMRAHLRRTQRFYEALGPVALEEARDLGRAHEMFELMAQVHGQRWQADGQEGAFASDYQRRFHHRIIESGFPRGQVQLLRLSAGEQTVAAIYNFVFQGRVLVYNFGVNYPDDKRVQPGLLAHYLAINLNAAQGRRHYDFLGGSNYYKTHLSSQAGDLAWLRVQRPSLKTRLRNTLGDLRRGAAGEGS